MDYNDREKSEFFNFEVDIKSDIINEKLQLRKQKNNYIIMEKRKKRTFLTTQKDIYDNDLNNINHGKSQNKKYLLDDSDILINQPLINKITKDNIKLILEYLNSGDFEKIKWVLYSLRIHFEYNNPDLNEYLILLENNINKYLESLITKYKDIIYIINEIFFLIANLFGSDEIINKYKESYFSCFLNEFYLSVYQKYLELNENELIISIFFLLENILSDKNSLIMKIFKEDELIYSIIRIIKKDRIINSDIIIHFIKFSRILIKGIKKEYIENIALIHSIIDRNIIIYKMYDNFDINIIKDILYLIIDSFNCKRKDENDIDDCFMINYVFQKRDEDENNNNGFIHFFCSSLYNHTEFYCNNIDALITTLDFLRIITYHCRNANLEELFECKTYKLLDILNKYYEYLNKNNSETKKNEIYIILSLLKICNNIIDVDLSLALKIIFSELFGNLIKYFCMNLKSKIIVDEFLKVFLRLLGHEDERIADNLFKRGIIHEGILCNLLYGCNNRNYSFTEEMIVNMCKIICIYLKIVFNPVKKMFEREDYILCFNFKEFIINSDIITEDNKECLLNLEFMNFV